MPIVRKNQDATVTVFGPDDTVTLGNGTRVSVASLTHWKDEQLATLSFYRLPDNPDTPANKALRGITYRSTPTGVEQVLELDDLGPAFAAWPPLTIVQAVTAIDPAKAEAILKGAPEVNKAMFLAARLVREDNPMLLAALASGGISIDELKSAIAALPEV